MTFYVSYGPDSAVLGFSRVSDEGRAQYCPMYASTYRGLPRVTLNVFASDNQEEMWVRSSWSGFEVLAYHRIGTDTCMTHYGENTFIDTPLPQQLSGGGSPFPKMAPGRAKAVRTIEYPGP